MFPILTYIINLSSDINTNILTIRIVKNIFKLHKYSFENVHLKARNLTRHLKLLLTSLIVKLSLV